MRTNTLQEDTGKQQKYPVIRVFGTGLLWGVLLSTLLLVLCSALLVYAPLPQAMGPVLVLLCGFLGAGLGAFRALRTLGKQGLLLGLWFGCCYFLFLFAASFFYTWQLPEFSAVCKEGLCCLIGGTVGGIFGVNKPQKRRS